MILSAHQPAYLPWPGWYDKIVRSDAFVILDNVDFSDGNKENFVNRNKIKAGDRWIWRTIPVHAPQKTKIRDVKIVDDTWAARDLKTIQQYYGKHPFWDEIWPGLKMYIEHIRERGDLSALNTIGPFEWTPFACAKREFRIQSEIGIAGDKNELIVNLCRYFNADTFMFGPIGFDWANPPYLRDHGITATFLFYDFPVYPQRGKEKFIPNLSIIDMLFNIGIEGTRKLICGK